MRRPAGFRRGIFCTSGQMGRAVEDALLAESGVDGHDNRALTEAGLGGHLGSE